MQNICNCELFALCLRQRKKQNDEQRRTAKNQRGGAEADPAAPRGLQGDAGLRHATVEDIIERVQSRNKEVTVSTIYRILDSFCSANILSFIYHPDTGKCYYDITVAEHHHLFDGKSIEDYADPELSQLIREYLERKHFPTEEIGKVQVQVTLKKNV